MKENKFACGHLHALLNRHPDVAGQITLDTFDEIGKKTPLLVDLKPSGENYMTDFHNAGGMLALLHTLRPLLYLDALTISGRTLGEELDAHPFKSFSYSSEVIRPLSNPLYPNSSLAILRGNLAPGAAVIKASASKERQFLSHSGPAVVFKNTEDLSERIDDPNLQVTKDSVLILQSIGPIGHPGMPEAGMIPIPRKLGNQGVKDMLRLSDGRMSGSAGGTIVLHISPESVIVDSVFGIVKDGDIVRLNIEERSLSVDLSDDEIKRRIEQRETTEQVGARVGKRIATKKRGYRGLYESRVNQAELGADFDFLTAAGADAI